MSARPDALWQQLREAGVVQGEPPSEDADAPWFVRLMLGIAGWIGAIFLFGFFSVALQELLRSTAARTVLGAVLCGAAALVLRTGRRGELLGQFAFAGSLAGQALLASGLGEALHRSPAGAALAIAAQQAILFAAVPGVVHRTWTAATAAYAAALALGIWGLGPYAAAVLTAGFALVALRELSHARHPGLLRAAAYGLGVAAFIASLVHGTWGDLYWLGRVRSAAASDFPGGAFAGAVVVVASVAALLRREGLPLGSPAGALALIGALVVAGAAFKAPGIAPAAALLVFGHANGNRVLAGVGILALIGYLAYYYYSLQATLLEKSALLAAAGLALLAMRFAMQRILQRKEADRA